MSARAWIRVLALLAATLAFLMGTASSCTIKGAPAAASRQFEAGQYAEAAAILRGALEKNAQDAALHHWLARAYFEQRDFNRAISSAERSVQLDPGNSEYHDWLGRAYGRKAEQAGLFGGFSLAKKVRREFEEAVRLNASNFSAQHDLIEFYLEAPGIVGGGDDKARQQAEKLVALDAVEGHVARGNYWVDQKKPEQAAAEFRLALEGKPKRIEPYFEMADFYQQRNDPVRMEEAVEAAARVDPKDPRLSYYRGQIRVLAGNRLDEAEKFLKTYLETVSQCSDYPSHGWAHELLGQIYEKQSQCAAAAEGYRKALEIDPRSKSARNGLRRAEKCASRR